MITIQKHRKDYSALETLIFWKKNMWCLSNFFYNWDSLHARLNSHYEAWNYEKKKYKKIKVYRNLSKTNVYLKVSVNSRLKKHLKIIDQRKALNLAVPVKTLLT